MLRKQLKELARVRRRFGSRRLHVFLRREGHEVNHKRLFRVYREELLHVPRSGGHKRSNGTRAPIALALMPNQRWSLDFVSDHQAKTQSEGYLKALHDYQNIIALRASANISHSVREDITDPVIVLDSAHFMQRVADPPPRSKRTRLKGGT